MHVFSNPCEFIFLTKIIQVEFALQCRSLGLLGSTISGSFMYQLAWGMSCPRNIYEKFKSDLKNVQNSSQPEFGQNNSWFFACFIGVSSPPKLYLTCTFFALQHCLQRYCNILSFRLNIKLCTLECTVFQLYLLEI